MQSVAPTSVYKTGFFEGVRKFFKFQPPKPKPQVIVMFCKQLSSFVRVGIPVTSAIQAFAEQAPKKSLRKTYLAVVSDLERGVRLSAAFAAHPLVFPSLVTDMVRSAEVTGKLETVLRQAAKHIEREASARRKIRSAMILSLCLGAFAAGSLFASIEGAHAASSGAIIRTSPVAKSQRIVSEPTRSAASSKMTRLPFDLCIGVPSSPRSVP